MDDLKSFYKNEEEIDLLVRTVHAFSTDIGMEFGMEKLRNSYNEGRKSS